MTPHDTGAEEQGHEQSGVAGGLVVRAGIGVGLLVAFALFAMWLLLGRFERRQAATRPPANALAVAEGARRPPAPRLQVNPHADLHALHEREEAQLHALGWADRAAGRVRIPIERAMTLLAEGQS